MGSTATRRGSSSGPHATQRKAGLQSTRKRSVTRPRTNHDTPGNATPRHVAHGTKKGTLLDNERANTTPKTTPTHVADMTRKMANTRVGEETAAVFTVNTNTNLPSCVRQASDQHVRLRDNATWPGPLNVIVLQGPENQVKGRKQGRAKLKRKPRQQHHGRRHQLRKHQRRKHRRSRLIPSPRRS